MEITPHARPPTVSTAAKDKVVCLMPRKKRKVATSRRASRADDVVGNVARPVRWRRAIKQSQESKYWREGVSIST